MIPSVNKILYVSDVAEGSRPAFRFAVSLAKQYEASMKFLHVIEPIPDSVKVTIESTLSVQTYAQLRSEGADNLRKIVATRIDDFCNSELEELGWRLQIDSLIVEGAIHEQILAVAKETKADMIVMGTRTHSATKEFFMGSTAHKIIRCSNIPVTIVPLG